METNNFGVRAKNFMIQLANSRLKLLRLDRSRKQDENLFYYATKIKAELSSVFSNKLVARYLVQHQEMIRNLLPGGNNKESWARKFQNFIREADNYWWNQSIYSPDQKICHS
jgi:hypothetical protein